MIQVALASNLERAANWLALGLALGVATRMDFVLLAAPALLLYLVRKPSVTEFTPGLGLACICICAMLGVRYAYYGAWLPNTYYLKATHWPLSERLARGS